MAGENLRLFFFFQEDAMKKGKTNFDSAMNREQTAKRILEFLHRPGSKTENLHQAVAMMGKSKHFRNEMKLLEVYLFALARVKYMAKVNV